MGAKTPCVGGVTTLLVGGKTGAVQEFEVILVAVERGPGCGIRLPFDPKAEFGRGRAPVAVTVDDHAPFRTTTMSYGGVSWIGLRQDQQVAFGVGVGDRVRVTIARDDLPREVNVPDELADALRDAPDAMARFERLSYTHRKEYARWVGEAKRQPTRDARAANAVEMLRRGEHSPG